MLFDNSLNDKRFRIDIRTENGYEEGCTRGANLNPPNFRLRISGGSDHEEVGKTDIFRLGPDRHCPHP